MGIFNTYSDKREYISLELNKLQTIIENIEALNNQDLDPHIKELNDCYTNLEKGNNMGVGWI